MERTSQRFNFKGPGEIAPFADAWLQGAEMICTDVEKVLNQPPPWLKKPGRCDIRFRVDMTPGVGATGGGHGVNFHLGTALAVTQPFRILNTPFTRV